MKEIFRIIAADSFFLWLLFFPRFSQSNTHLILHMFPSLHPVIFAIFQHIQNNEFIYLTIFLIFMCACISRLLVGAPLESTGKKQTGDVFRCPLDSRNSANCTRLHLGEQHGWHCVQNHGRCFRSVVEASCEEHLKQSCPSQGGKPARVENSRNPPQNTILYGLYLYRSVFGGRVQQGTCSKILQTKLNFHPKVNLWNIFNLGCSLNVHNVG